MILGLGLITATVYASKLNNARYEKLFAHTVVVVRPHHSKMIIQYMYLRFLFTFILFPQ